MGPLTPKDSEQAARHVAGKNGISRSLFGRMFMLSPKLEDVRINVFLHRLQRADSFIDRFHAVCDPLRHSKDSLNNASGNALAGPESRLIDSPLELILDKAALFKISKSDFASNRWRRPRHAKEKIHRSCRT